MIRLKAALSEEDVKKTGLAQLRQAYINLAKDFNKILDGNVYYCHSCNEFHSID